MKFVFFYFGERRKGLGDEGADGGNAPQNVWATAARQYICNEVIIKHTTTLKHFTALPCK